ncbi:MAG: ABC transporter permease [Tissierellia bacterium]|nr:ABC transporter permease [Bacillota bacterium]NLL22945.1 ABC transporter permease [Tissierellia bacterium]
MAEFFIKKFVRMIITLIIATFAVFILIQNAPSDPVTMMLTKPDEMLVSSDKELLEQKIQETKEEFGLNDHILIQYKNWMQNILSGRMGKSLITKVDIASYIAKVLPSSVLIALVGTLLQLVFALIAGVLSVVYVSKWQEHAIRLVAIFLRSVPFFAIGFAMLMYFSVNLKIYEVSNSAALSRLWLPAFAVGITIFPKLSRIIRNSLLDEMGKTYMVAYVAKGFDKRKLIAEALQNTMIPIFTTLSMSFASSVGGMVITERIFSWPGIGNFGMSSVITQDYPAVQAYVLVITFIVVIVNFLSDMLYPLINPVVREE